MALLIDEDVDLVQQYLDDDIKRTEISSLLGVSTQTLYRFIHKHNLSIPKFSDISDDDLVDVIIDIKRNHPKDGETLMHGHLMARERPIKVPRWRLRKAIHFIDGATVQERKAVPIKRRKYSVPCPRHIDGNHKLIKYKMVIHGGVCGFTRLVVFMNLSTNNKAQSVLDGFHHAVEQFGWPIRIRTDYGGENELLWTEMTSQRGAKAALVGSSVHNQPIEQLWNLINDKVTAPFRTLFEELEKEGKLHVENETDMMCIHYVFVPLIQANLTRYCKALNKRKISTELQHTPYQLESMFLHLKEHYEGRPIQETERHSQFAYLDPVDLERPLKHVKCEFLEKLPKGRRRQLLTVRKPTTIHQGKVAYSEVIQAVADYITSH